MVSKKRPSKFLDEITGMALADTDPNQAVYILWTAKRNLGKLSLNCRENLLQLIIEWVALPKHAYDLLNFENILFESERDRLIRFIASSKYYEWIGMTLYIENLSPKEKLCLVQSLCKCQIHYVELLETIYDDVQLDDLSEMILFKTIKELNEEDVPLLKDHRKSL